MSGRQGREEVKVSIIPKRRKDVGDITGKKCRSVLVTFVTFADTFGKREATKGIQRNDAPLHGGLC